MKTRIGKDEEGNVQIYRQGKSGDGSVSWMAFDPDKGSEQEATLHMAQAKAMPDDAPSGATDAERVKAANDKRFMLEKSSEDSSYLKKVRAERGEAAYDRAIEARGRHWVGDALLSAGRETDKLGAGIADIADIARGMAGEDITENLKRRDARAADQASKDEYYREQDEGGSTLAQLGGGALPYSFTGIVGGPATSKIAGKAIDAFGKAATTTATNAATKGGKTLSDIAQKYGSKVPGAAWAADQAAAPFTKVARKLRNKKTRAPFVQEDLYRANVGRTLAGSAALGGLEGAAHYDFNPIEGALASIAGTAGGKALEPILSRAPNYNRQQRNDLLDWGEDQGLHFTPGMRRGDRAAQKFEAGLQSAGDYTDDMGLITRANDLAMESKALESMGMPPRSNAAGATQKETLSKHKSDMGKEFDRLEAQTVGRFDPQQVATMKKRQRLLSQSKRPSSRKAAKAMKDTVDEFAQANRSVQRTPDGKIKPYTFEGKDYKQLKGDLKGDIADARKNGHNKVAEELEWLEGELEQAIKRGQSDYGGEAAVKHWEDLAERYAMTKIVMKHGMDMEGNFDGRKLSNFFSSDENIERTILEQGSDRVTNLMKLSKLSQAQSKQLGSDLSGTGIQEGGGSGRMGPFQKLIVSPLGKHLPLGPKMYMKSYMSDIPGGTGLLGMGRSGTSMDGWWKPDSFTRPLSQSSKMHPTVVNKGMDAWQTIQDFINDSKEKEQN